MQDNGSINRAFTSQALHYDRDDNANKVIGDLRRQVYAHVQRYINPDSHILELNAGTGIDALWFVSQGHRVLATDLSTGMIDVIGRKINTHQLQEKLSVRQLSYDRLNEITDRGFDYVFSNFGGLNCVSDLTEVTKHLTALLKPGAYVTWVIMPPVCGWEILAALKGKKSAFRRWNKNGVMAHINGEYFRTWYHSLGTIKSALGDNFEFVSSEGLAAISPPPHRHSFPDQHPALYRSLRRMDNLVNRNFPFDRCADHIITTFRMKDGSI